MSVLTSQVNLAPPLGAHHYAQQRLGDEGVAISSGFGGRPSLTDVLMKRCQLQIAAAAAGSPSVDGVEQLPFLSRNLPAGTWEHPDARKLLGQDRVHPLLLSASSFQMESSMRNGRKRGFTSDEIPIPPSLFDDALGMEPTAVKRSRSGSDLSMPQPQEDEQSQLNAQAILDDFAGASPESSTSPPLPDHAAVPSA